MHMRGVVPAECIPRAAKTPIGFSTIEHPFSADSLQATRLTSLLGGGVGDGLNDLGKEMSLRTA